MTDLFERATQKAQEQLEGQPVAPVGRKMVQVGEQEVVLPGTLPDYIDLPTGWQQDHTEIPNYDRLSRTERWIMDRLPGFSESKVGQALAKFAESPFGKMLSFLDVPAEGLERGAGFVTQFLAAAADPDNFENFSQHLGEAWYAGSLAADMANLPRIIDGKLQFPSDLPGFGGLVDARNQISALVEQGVDPGEALIQVRDAYYESQGALALRSQIHDAFMHIFADPLNVVLPYLKPIERLNAFKITNLTQRALPDELINSIDNITALIAKAEDAGDAAEVRRLTPILESLENAEKVSPLAERVLRTFGAIPEEDLPRFAGKLNPLTLTPEARAHQLWETVLDNIGGRIVAVEDNPEAVVRALQRALDGTLGPEFGHMLVSAEGRYVKGALEAIVAKSNDLLLARRTTQPQRELLELVARVVGETPEALMGELLDGNEVQALERFMSGLDEFPEVAQALDRMGIAREAFTPEELGKLADTFKNVEIYTDELWKTELMRQISDVTMQYAVGKFGVKAKGTLLAMAEAVKAAETLGFLRLNPGYPLRNWLNNNFTMMARGAFGQVGADFSRQLWERLGFEPLRLTSGFGPAGLRVAGTQAAAGKLSAAALDSGIAILREASEGGPGWVNKIKDFFSGVKLPEVQFKGRNIADMGELAATIEATASARATTAGYLHGWNQIWKQGKGFTGVWDWNPQLAETLSDNVMQRMHQAIGSAMTEAELDAALLSDNLNLTQKAVFDLASENYGAPIENILTPEFTEQVMPRILDAAKNGVLDDEIPRVLGEVHKHLDNLTDEALESMRLDIASLVETEGPQAYVKFWGDVTDEFWGAHEKHGSEVSRMMKLIREIDDPAIRGSAIDALLQNNEKFWTRQWNRFEARMQGFSDGAKAINLPLADEAVGSFRSWRSSWKRFFKWRRNGLEKVKNGDLDFATFLSEANTRYAKAMLQEDDYLRAMDDILVRMMPEEDQALFRAYRDGVAVLRREDRQLVQDFRLLQESDEWSLLNAEERQLRWTEHWQERQAGWAKIKNEEQAGLAALQGHPEAQGRYAAQIDESDIPDIPFAGRWFTSELEGEAGALKYLQSRQEAGLPAVVTYVDMTEEEAAKFGLRAVATEMSPLDQSRTLGISVDPDVEYMLSQELANTRQIFQQGITPDPTEGMVRLYRGESGLHLPTEPLDEAWRQLTLPDYNQFVPRQMYMDTGLDQLWFNRGDDAMNSIFESARQLADEKPFKLADLPADAQNQMRNYVSHVKGQMSDARRASTRMGLYMRDSALLNYNRRMNYNNWLGTLMPYEFWMTQSIGKWAMHTLDRPAMLTTFLRMKKFAETAFRPEGGLPSRLKGSFRINVPFLPEWMGKDLFVDPMRTALPFDQFVYPWQEFLNQENRDQGVAQRVLREMLNDGRITQQEFDNAMATQSGPAWDKAVVAARQDDTEGRLNGFDLATLLTSPHAPLMWAYNVARGTPEEIQPFLPLTRSIKGVTALLGISPNTGGLNPEGMIRKALGLPAFDQWDDYRVDRMLSNLAATGEISVDVALRAMIERGKTQDAAVAEAFRLATERAGKEYGVGALGSLIGIPAKAYPVGEENLRQLKDDYQAAWARYEEGDLEAVNRFYDQHPEYETRLALFKSPEERLRSFLVDEIWNTYNDMPTLHRKELNNHLGDLWSDAFLNKETRSYESIPMEALQVWLKIMGGDPPGMVHYNEDATPLEFSPPEVAHAMQTFYNMRDNVFRYSEQVWPLWSEYFSLEKGDARRAYWNNHPILGQYMNWRNDFMMRNPSLAPYIEDDPDKRPQYPSEAALLQALTGQPNFTPQEWRQVLGLSAYNLLEDALRGEPLPQVVIDSLESQGFSPDLVLSQIGGAP